METLQSTRQQATAALARLTARPDAAFRDSQFEAIEALVDHRRRVVVVQRTGWGKSAVYFVATALLRERGSGPTVLISPLLSLMRDQVGAAMRAGVRAHAINSANAAEWDEIYAGLDADTIDILLLSPERLTNPEFAERHLPKLLARCGLLVVDEAHCISDWGHDFRPDYRRIGQLLAELPSDLPVLATTATANERVSADISEQLRPGAPGEVLTLRGGLARASLRLGVMALGSDAERLGWLVQHLGDLPGSGIIYSLTVSGAEQIASALRDAGFNVAAYTGKTDTSDREALENALKSNEVKALVATSALGMGFDKPDLGFVVHVGAPDSPVGYYQQVGRAGRATDSADVLLLPTPSDRRVWEYFATASMPDPQQAEAVLTALREATGPLSAVALDTVTDASRSKIELLLKMLGAEGAVRRVRGGYEATGKPWVFDAERYERVAQARRAEQHLMIDYCSATTCRMAYLQRCLDDPQPADCGRCDNCAGAWWSTTIDQQATARASSALQSTVVDIEPRKQWPSKISNLGVPVSGKIGVDMRHEAGRALARANDLGLGQRLATEMTKDGPVPQWLQEPTVGMLKSWGWQTRPTSVVAMCSHTHPVFTDSWARGISSLGRMPFAGVVRDTRPELPAPATDVNSAFRVKELWNRYAIDPEALEVIRDAGGPVLLVDATVRTGWAFTIVTATLRASGVQTVLPCAALRT